MAEAFDPLEPVAKSLPAIKDALQRHHDYYLGLKPEEIEEGDQTQIRRAKLREARGEVKPLIPPEQQPQG